MAYDMAYKHIQSRKASGKVLRDKAFEISNNPKFDGYQHRIASMSTSFLIKNLETLLTTEQEFAMQILTQYHRTSK